MTPQLKETGKTDDLRDGLRKERRLLIIASLILLAHVGFGLTVDRSAESLGLKFEVRDPGDVWIFVAIVWAWALIRYSLYFHDYIDDDMLVEVKRREYRAHEWIVLQRAKKVSKLEGFMGRGPQPGAIVSVELRDEPKEGFEGRLHYDSAHVSVVTENEAGGTDAGGTTFAQAIGPRLVRLSRAYAWTHLAVTTRYGTEYFVPFVLGLSPVAVMAWHHFVR